MANPVSDTYFWYEKGLRDSTVHATLWEYGQFLVRQNSAHFNNMLRNVRLYSGRNLSGLTPYSYFKQLDHIPAQTSSINIVQSVVDTIVSRISGTVRPAVQFVTSNGTWSTQRLARKLTAWLDGLFEEIKIHEIGPQIVRDASICGDGYLAIFAEGKKVKAERVHPFDLFVDQTEAVRGAHRQIFRRMFITRDRLESLYPTKKAEIRKAMAYRPGGEQSSSQFSDDLIEVLEAIRLSSGMDEEDGRRAVVIETATLEYKRYERTAFPFVRYSYSRPFIGPYGQSPATRLQRSQVMINRLLKIIDTSLIALAAPKIWMPPGSDVSDQYVREPGAVLRTTTAPQILAQEVNNPEIYQYLETVIQRAYKSEGVSEQSATAQKSPGITSAVAINAVDDLQSDRLAIPSLDYESFIVEVSHRCIETAKEIIEEEHSYEVRVKRGNSMESIDLAELDTDEKDYTLEIDPVNGLTKALPGKLQMVAQLQSVGVIAPYQVPRMLRNPDLDSWFDAQTAAADNIGRKIDQILDDPEDGYEAPDPIDDLDLSMQLFTAAYQKASADKAPDNVLRALRKYMTAIHARQAPPPAATGAPMVPGGGAPAPGPSMAPAAPNPATLQAA